ncbi:unnamed protein product [Trichobilharzia szidati]|nr:unnamed protein product [Trichobilharzia szidati]
MSLLIDDSNHRPIRSHFKWSFGRHKSDNVNTANAFIPPRYMFSYETTDSNVKQIEFTKPSELLYPNGAGDRQETFDFSTAFSFCSENKLDGNDLDVANNYKTIFTYSDPICNVDYQLSTYDYTDSAQRKYLDSRVYYAIIALSGLLLVLFFPFLCWFYVKHLIKSERMIVFRLGKRMKAKGPGWVFMLPICDRFHRITLDEQTVKIKPVSGGTQDEAVVEVTCSSTFYLLEPEYAYSMTSKSPVEIVSTQTQLCILSALSHLEWNYLEHGNAKIDLANETKGTLNTRCSAYGIHVKEVEIGDLVLLRPPPPVNKNKSHIELVSKHLQQLSCVLLNTRETSSQFSKMSGLSIQQQQQQQEQETSSTINTGMISQHSESLSSSTITPGESTTTNNNNSTISTIESQKQFHYKPINSLQHLWLSHNHPSLSRAITRAQGLLNSDIACEALERALLQLVISTSSAQIKFTKDNLPSVDSAESLGYTLLYLDANSGKVGVGSIALDKQPNATLYIHINDLIDVVEGRLDVLKAIESGQVFMTGSLSVLSKMRHLLYLSPA